ncbi:Asp23/Gls24 family envelope stress response protein [Acaricomes phytoseiuli]|uniref:Asp23/Gls24 family envelope stress response protein n=1 Tax=Acaricomes phytoseiuli TaxID=291968 RepID=UPI002223E585|nr:Asp23/Gls24 family envelope stress response protein [Acaricomes phytoseiuli]MCW1249624.1 Asp23/Gls24 family envelope stress response protein [Acaricomes phytoseiuli]
MDHQSSAAPTVPRGRTSVSHTAVAKIARAAARRISGVASLAPQSVRVVVGETQVAVDIQLVAQYGTSLQDLADRVRDAVYREMRQIVGMQVMEVNVEISRVYLPESLSSKAPPDNRPNPQDARKTGASGRRLS